VAKDINDAVREVCLSFPGAEEFSAHGSPNFRVRGKTFAMYTVNHHGDGRVSLWLSSPPGAQEVHVAGEPKHFFVPPYVGPRGWLGVHLDKGLGVDRQGLLTADERFRIPAYMGHNGWIELDAHDAVNEGEARDLALASYHHFANKRMLTALESLRPARSRMKTKRTT